MTENKSERRTKAVPRIGPEIAHLNKKVEYPKQEKNNHGYFALKFNSLEKRFLILKNDRESRQGQKKLDASEYIDHDGQYRNTDS